MRRLSNHKFFLWIPIIVMILTMAGCVSRHSHPSRHVKNCTPPWVVMALSATPVAITAAFLMGIHIGIKGSRAAIRKGGG